MDLPATQRAYILPAMGSPPTLTTTHPVPAANALLPGQCLVHISHSGVCRSDLGILRGAFSHLRPKPNLVGGHEGVGVVVAMNNAENEEGIHRDEDDSTMIPVRVGSRVGVKYVGYTCMRCELCLGGADQYCSARKSHAMNFDGTFAEYTVAYKDQLIPIPDTLDSAPAAPLLCAGVVAYNALCQSNTRPGDWIAIFGAGGGVGHFTIQYAKALDLNVIAVDTGSSKRALCSELGAHAFIDYARSSSIAQDIIDAVHSGREQNNSAQTHAEPIPGVHAIIVTAGSPDAYDAAIAAAMICLRPRGTLINVGLPPSKQISIPVIPFSMRGLTMRGVFVGTRKQTREALEIAASGKVKPRYVLRGLSEMDLILDELEKGETIGKIVVDILN